MLLLTKMTKLWLIIISINLLFPWGLKAQIIPDNSLGGENSTYSEESGLIEGGATREENLFHSFREFNIQEQQKVYFSNPERVTNIFVRITGNNPSEILGTLGVTGSANLYLLNPQGIIFGSNASLDVQGSFLATTAESILFNDGSQFSSNLGENQALLTVNVPIGLQFGPNPGNILNTASGSEETEERVPVGLQVASDQTIALVGGDVFLEEVSINTNGGQIILGSVGDNSQVGIVPNFKGFTINYQGVENFQDLTLNSTELVTDGENLGDIQLHGRNIVVDDSVIFSLTREGSSGNIIIEASELINFFGDFGFIQSFAEGNSLPSDAIIRLTAPTIIIDGGAQVLSVNLTANPGSDIFVEASELIEIKGFTSDVAFASSIFALTDVGNGTAGNIVITTKNLRLSEVGQISSSTFGPGRGGDILIEASESIEMGGSFEIVDTSEEILSGIFAQVERGSTGDAGNIVIKTENLIAAEGAQISTSILDRGKGGDIEITVGDTLRLTGTSPNADLEFGSSGIFISAEPAYQFEEGGEVIMTTGDAGSLGIEANRLIIEDGGKISADTFGTGRGGDVEITVNQLIIESGGNLRAGSLVEENSLIESQERGDGGRISIEAVEFIRVSGTGTVGDVNPQAVVSSISTQSQGAGNAGDLNLSTPQLTVTDGATITASGSGSGQGGNLQISSNSINLNNGSITAATASNQGGNVTLQGVSDRLVMQNQSQITATAGSNTGIGDGGNLSIDADAGFIIAVPQENNNITANAFQGRGGNINLITEAIFGLVPREELTSLSDISASSELGLDGNILIEVLEIDPLGGTLELSNEIVDIDTIVVQDPCAPIEGNIASGSSFVVTGKGGLPPNSQDPALNTHRVVEWQTLNTPITSEPSEAVIIRRREPDSNTNLQQARGWLLTPDGTVVLTSEPNSPHNRSTPALCNPQRVK